MNEILSCELSFDELEAINGGANITSRKVYLAANLCLLVAAPPVGATLLVVSYINSEYLIPNIEY